MNRNVLDVEKLSMEEESLKCELNRIKTELFFREENLEMLKNYNKSMNDQVAKLENSYDDNRLYFDILQSYLDSTRSSLMYQSHLKKFVEKNEPIVEHQLEKLNMFKEEYSRMLARYEDSPIYNDIIHADAEEKHLTHLIAEKRNQIMKLETEQEY